MTEKELDELSERLRLLFEDWSIAYNNGHARACDIMLCLSPEDVQ